MHCRSITLPGCSGLQRFQLCDTFSNPTKWFLDSSIGGNEEMDLRKNIEENSRNFKQVICGESGMKGAKRGSVFFKNDGG